MIKCVIFKILIFILYINLSQTSHFQGGTITYKIVNTYGSIVSIMITQTYLYRYPVIYCDNARVLSQSTPNFTVYAEYNYTLNCVANCTTSGGYKPVSVRTSCTDYSAAMAISVTERTDIVNITSGAYFTVAFVSSAWRTLDLPSSSLLGWSIACTIDLRLRSDTGQPNTPPVANMISPIYIPVSTRTALVIPTIDSDNDVVRCRFANTSTECADVCPPASLPANTILIESNCTLLITGANNNDWYAVAIQIEDFINANSTTALSSVPVQFLINVYSTPKCTTPPLLYGPSNQTSACQNLQVGQPYTITLYAYNYCSSKKVTISDIATLSFPIVLKSNLTNNASILYSVTLNWTPTASQVGSQILCAVAIDSQEVQSNQYCLAFVVSSQNNTVTCPGTVLETTTSLINTQTTYTNYEQNISSETTSTTMTTDIITSMTSAVDDNTQTTTNVIEDTTATTINIEDETTSITSNIIRSTTTSSSSEASPWLLPLIAVLVSLIPLICCLCLCCPPPYGFGLLCRKCNRKKSEKTVPMTDQIRRPPRMYMIRRIFGPNFDAMSRNDSTLTSSSINVGSDQPLNRFPLTFRNRSNNEERNLVWVYPSPRSNNMNKNHTNIASSRNMRGTENRSARFPLTVRNLSNRKEKNVVWVHPSPRSDNITRDDTSLASSISTNEPEGHSDRFPLTFRNRSDKLGKNVVWVYPSPRTYTINSSEDSLQSSRSATESDIRLDIASPISRHNSDKHISSSTYM